MAKGSTAYAAMRRALIAEVSRIPRGSVVEVGRLGQALNIPARHAASILARLTEEEAALVPWHRVLPKAGVFDAPERRSARRAHQWARLAEEGHRIDADNRLSLDPGSVWTPDDQHGETFWADVDPDTQPARR